MNSKHRVNEFTINDLPHNRKQLFFDCLKQYWLELLGISFLLILATIPIVIDLVITDFIAISISSNANLTSQSQESSLFILQIIKHLVLIPCFLVFGIVLSGALRVYRSITFGEGVLFFPDFIKGIKQNIKYTVLTSLILGILNFLSMLIINIQGTNIPLFMLYLPLFIILLFIFPVFIVGFLMSNLYTNAYIKTIKSSSYFFVRYFFLYLVTYILTFSFAFSLLIPIMLIRYILFFALELFVLPIGLLLLVIVSNYVFDRHINKNQFPTLFRKGLM